MAPPHAITTTIVSTLTGCISLAPLVFATGAIISIVPASAEATTYRVESRTSARATQHLRSDTRLAAPRVLSQSLTLRAFDLRGEGEDDFNATVSLRYSTDFGLDRRYRTDPLFEARWNDISLDLAYLQWQPVDGLEVVAGRQWHRSPLGMTDFDGVTVDWRATSGNWRPFARVAAGRDVQRGLTPFDPGAFDIQGLPPNETVATDSPWHLMAATNAGLQRRGDHRIEVGSRHLRRPRNDDSARVATTHRYGATATVSPTDPVTVTTTGSFHSLIDRIDRARLDAAYYIEPGALSVGIDHRRPIFDSGSIFNLFGTRPHRSGYATYRHFFDAIATTTRLRVWGRLYFDDQARLFDPGDEQALGAAVSNRHRFELLVPLDLFWQLSAQTLTGGSGGDQYLGSARLRAPMFVDDLFVTGRLTGLWATPDHHRRRSGHALTAGLGAELGLGEIGELSVTFENRSGSFVPTNTAVFAMLQLEAGP